TRPARSGHSAHGYRVAGAALVPDDDRVLEALAELLADEAREEISAAAGGVGHDHPDRFRRVVLGLRAGKEGKAGREQRGGGDKLTTPRIRHFDGCVSGGAV